MNQETKGFFLYFFRAYPGRTALMVGLLAGAGLAEGIGIAALLPVLEFGTVVPGEQPSEMARAVGNFLQGIGLEPSLVVLLGIIVAALWLKGVFRWLAMRNVGFVVARVGMDLRLRLIRALMRAEWGYFASSPAGHFANAVSREAFQAAAAYREACQALAGAATVVVYATVVVLTSWQIALAAFFVGLLLLIVLRGFVGASRRAGREQTSVMRTLVARLTEALPNLKPLKAMARERSVLPLLEAEVRGFNSAQQRQVQAGETLHSFQEPLLVAAVAVGLFIVMTFTSTPFSTVLVMTFLFYRLVNHMSQIQQRYASVVTGESAFWSLMNLIEKSEAAEEQRLGTSPRPALESSLEMRGLSFSHGETEVFRDVNLEIPAGSFVALEGVSGAGKTTLVDLIIGLYRPQAGKILVDGIDLEEVDVSQWRSAIGYVPQDLLLFHDSILKNVRLGNETIPREAVEQALRSAGAWEFVQTLPGGMDWTVG
ncbi:MAG: ABC transporter ATP-binding protein, partial [Gemmatimonadetes bacterium]|nr:ABC transporter ATP-binding protein [Gemmatimonadota bacterium]